MRCAQRCMTDCTHVSVTSAACIIQDGDINLAQDTSLTYQYVLTAVGMSSLCTVLMVSIHLDVLKSGVLVALLIAIGSSHRASSSDVTKTSALKTLTKTPCQINFSNPYLYFSRSTQPKDPRITLQITLNKPNLTKPTNLFPCSSETLIIVQPPKHPPQMIDQHSTPPQNPYSNFNLHPNNHISKIQSTLHLPVRHAW